MHLRIVGLLLAIFGALVAGPIVINWVLPPDTQKAIYGEPSVYLLSGYIVLFLLIGTGLVIGKDITSQK